jgi:hypothetical protein
MYDIAQEWATSLMREIITDIREISSRESFQGMVKQYPRTGLNVLCNRLAGFCDLCNLTKRYNQNTKLQLCEVCDLLFRPLITLQRLESFYTSADSTATARVLEPIRCYDLTEFGPQYSWGDIEALYQRGDLLLKPRDEGPTKYSSEEYGHVVLPFEDSISYGEGYWPRTASIFRFEDEWDHLKSIQGISPSEIRPVTVELRLLDQFLYRFDPNWAPSRGIEKEDISRYYKIARNWLCFGNWDKRPWGLESLPAFPRCLITNPHASHDQKERSTVEMHRYRFHCARIRAVMRAFPDILCEPDTWQRCVEWKAITFNGAVKLATNEAVKFAGKERNFELNERFVIAKQPLAGDHNVKMLNYYGESGFGTMIDVVKSDGSYISKDGGMYVDFEYSDWTSAQTCV